MTPTDTLNAKVSQAPSPARFCFTGGVYRNQSITPRPGDVFVVAAGAQADLNGSVLIPSSEFEQVDGLWVVSRALAEGAVGSGKCASETPKCNQPNDLFRDGVALMPQGSRAEVKATGQWFLDAENRRIVMFDDPHGHTIELSTTPQAFKSSADSVLIDGASSTFPYGIIVEKYATPTSVGAIEECGGPCSTNWTVENVEIRLNHSYGISVGKASTTLRCNVHHNGQSGIGARGGPDILVRNTEIAFNNTLGYSYSWEAGGTKFVRTTNLVLDGNYVHDNKGPGLWCDSDNVYVIYENNTLARNIAGGIVHEQSFDAIIRNNTSTDDGYGTRGTSCYYASAIGINDSSNVEISGNTIINGQNGICGEESNRGSSKLYNRPFEIHNLNVHDNTIIQDSSTATASGIVQIGTGNAVYTQWNNHWDSNTYKMANSGASAFQWMATAVNFDEWQSYGHDHEGSVVACSSQANCFR